jgi:hypothetical protein
VGGSVFLGLEICSRVRVTVRGEECSVNAQSLVQPTDLKRLSLYRALATMTALAYSTSGCGETSPTLSWNQLGTLSQVSKSDSRIGLYWSISSI